MSLKCDFCLCKALWMASWVWTVPHEKSTTRPCLKPPLVRPIAILDLNQHNIKAELDRALFQSRLLPSRQPIRYQTRLNVKLVNYLVVSRKWWTKNNHIRSLFLFSHAWGGGGVGSANVSWLTDWRTQDLSPTSTRTCHQEYPPRRCSTGGPPQSPAADRTARCRHRSPRRRRTRRRPAAPATATRRSTRSGRWRGRPRRGWSTRNAAGSTTLGPAGGQTHTHTRTRTHTHDWSPVVEI